MYKGATHSHSPWPDVPPCNAVTLLELPDTDRRTPRECRRLVLRRRHRKRIPYPATSLRLLQRGTEVPATETALPRVGRIHAESRSEA